MSDVTATGNLRGDLHPPGLTAVKLLQKVKFVWKMPEELGTMHPFLPHVPMLSNYNTASVF